MNIIDDWDLKDDDFFAKDIDFVFENVLKKDPVSSVSVDIPSCNSSTVLSVSNKEDRQLSAVQLNITNKTETNKKESLSKSLMKESHTPKRQKVEISTVISCNQLPESLLSITIWENTKYDVPAIQSLLSNIEECNVKSILHEASLKKMPKHTVAPFLCVSIKKRKAADSSLVLVDKTGEITGRLIDISENILTDIREGSSLLLTWTSLLCNVIVIKMQNIVAVFPKNGSPNFLQNLASCITSMKNNTADQNEENVGVERTVLNTTPADCVGSKEKLTSTTRLKHSPTLCGFSSPLLTSTQKDCQRRRNKSLEVSPIFSDKNEMQCNVEKTTNQALEQENAFSEESELDDFDELLCSIDENSFMG